MKHLFNILLAITAMFTCFDAQAQNPLNVTQIGHLAYSQTLSEVRGALHNGREYALVGVNNGFSIVDINDPTSPVEVFFEQGQNSIWRDPFYHNGHAYCVTEGGGGLLIVDMSPLPGSTSLPSTLYTGTNIQWSSAHNMFIDTDSDKAYIFGSDAVDGVIILDISSPMSPVEIGTWNDHYIHDGFVRGDTLWAGCLGEGAFVIDVSTPSSPVVLANWDTPSEFAHNIWPSDDNAYSYTTDEVNSGFVAAYDMSNLQNVVETDKVRHPLSEGVIPHNTHFLNDYLVTSHYRDGLTIHDVSDPANMVLTGYFDSSPMSGGGFNGAWGAWPYLPSGNILVADIEGGLFILGATYTRGALLEGTVTEFGTGSPINDVQIEVVSTNLVESTNLFGNYATGTATAGTYTVTFEKGGYLPETVTGVNLVNGQTVTLDVELVPDVPFVLSGIVTEEGTGDPIEGAIVQIVNEFFDINLLTDENGRYADSTFFSGDYEVAVGAWGYVGECVQIAASLANPAPNFDLAVGYYDDFALDFDWDISGNATTGVWVRDYPIGTEFNGTPANPSEDADGDCGGQAFVTGNVEGAVNIEDVDDGMTVLTSPPMDLSNYTHAFLQFEYWFFNQGGSSMPNDELVVKINNGSSIATIVSLPTTNDVWTTYSVAIQDHISLTDNMTVRFEIQDAPPGHLVEGGIDVFRILNATAIEERSENSVHVYPNPAQDFVNVNVSEAVNSGQVRILDVAGKLVLEMNQLKQGVNRIPLPDVAGVYLCEVVVDQQRSVSRLLVH